MNRALKILHDEIIACRACPRLVQWREQVAREKRRAFREWTYWGRPIVGFGDPAASIVIVGLAPAAHGANRTGRMFTGDRSGDFLFAALHRAGLANQATSVSRDDGLTLRDVFIVAPCRCAPPENKPTPDELSNCSHFMDREVELLVNRTIYVALGAIAWRAIFDHLERVGIEREGPRPAFGHGIVAQMGSISVIGSYHVSQQNTQTGRLTHAMIDGIFEKAKRIAHDSPTKLKRK